MFTPHLRSRGKRGKINHIGQRPQKRQARTTPTPSPESIVEHVEVVQSKTKEGFIPPEMEVVLTEIKVKS